MNELKWMSVKSVKDHTDMKETFKRSPFLKAYGAIIHSSQIRRLSHKTQVFLNPNSDYVRTRLTHSLEVSQIGRQLALLFCENLNDSSYKTGDFEGKFTVDFPELVSTACLAHDIGQAPFGHGGEKQLNRLVGDSFGGFEANKQNIRILVGSEMRDPLDVPYALVDAVMKYKSNVIFPKKEGGYYNIDQEQVTKVLTETGLTQVRHPACMIMECADDIGYICGDIEDAIKYRLIPKDELKSLLENIAILDENYESLPTQWDEIIDNNWNQPHLLTSYIMKAMISHVRLLLNNSDIKKLEEELPQQFQEYILSIQNAKEPLNILYCDNEKSNEIGKKFLNLKKTIYKNYILKSSIVQESEYFADKVIKSLFDEIMTMKNVNKESYMDIKLYNLLSTHVQNRIKNYFLDKNKDHAIDNKILSRITADYISGMTDRYAIYFWEKINSPNILKIAS